MSEGPTLHAWVVESMHAACADLPEGVAAQSVIQTVVVGAPLDLQRQERARRLGMEHLIYELEQYSGSRIWIESRHGSLNRRDQRMIDALRQRGTLSFSASVRFARPIG